MATRRRINHVTGFSLVELLVVVAVIALLVSLLLPALGRSRELAKRSVCSGQLRQNHLGLHTYARDHLGWFIPNVWGSMAHFDWNKSKGHARLLERYGFTLQTLSCPTGIYPAQFWPAPTNWAGPLALNYFYAGGYGLLDPDGNASEDYHGYYGFAYVNKNTPANKRPVPKMTMHNAAGYAPSDMMLMMDLARYAGNRPTRVGYLYVEYPTWYGISGGHIRSNHFDRRDDQYAEGANVLFLDGSARWRTAEQSMFRYSNYYNDLSW